MTYTSSTKLLSEEIEKESQMVRSMYDGEIALDWVNDKSVGYGPVNEESVINEVKRYVNTLLRHCIYSHKAAV